MNDGWRRLCDALTECTKKDMVTWRRSDDDDWERWTTARDVDGHSYLLTYRTGTGEIALRVCRIRKGRCGVLKGDGGTSPYLGQLYEAVIERETDPVITATHTLEAMIADGSDAEDEDDGDDPVAAICDAWDIDDRTVFGVAGVLWDMAADGPWRCGEGAWLERIHMGVWMRLYDDDDRMAVWADGHESLSFRPQDPLHSPGVVDRIRELDPVTVHGTFDSRDGSFEDGKEDAVDALRDALDPDGLQGDIGDVIAAVWDLADKLMWWRPPGKYFLDGFHNRVDMRLHDDGDLDVWTGDHEPITISPSDPLYRRSVVDRIREKNGSPE